jgi:hypothetical protein
MNLLKQQRIIAEQHYDARVFVEGVAGTGKTTAGIERVKGLLKAGVPAGRILILVPQPTLGLQWRGALRRARVAGSSSVRVATLGGIATELLDLYLPLVAADLGFENPLEPPHGLSLELVQYYMRRYLGPFIEQHQLFNSVHASPYRLYTQIVDNLNKAALVGFPHTELGERLKAAWGGADEQKRIYDDAQACANEFRELCRQRSLMDYSLQMAIFMDHLLPRKEVFSHLTRQYQHILVDNIEEDSPSLHDLLARWLPVVRSALLIYDEDGGHRRFLGADPTTAYALKDLCDVHAALDRQRIMSPAVAAFQAEFARTLRRPAPAVKGDLREAYELPNDLRYLPQMLDWVAEEARRLIHDEGVPPNEIVLLAAFLPDALRYLLETRLDAKGVPHRALRPSRALRDEPDTRTLLTLARLAHPHWDLKQPRPTPHEVISALMAGLGGLDIVRARLLVAHAYDAATGQLKPFDALPADVQERVTYSVGERYQTLRDWLELYQADTPLPLDIFLSRLFGEVLSQPGFGFHTQFDAAHVAANLIESAREFRQVVVRIEPDLDLPAEYVRSVLDGVLANQYVDAPTRKPAEAVLIAPAHAFLMNNLAVDYQFWLNIGGSGWGQRLYQPLTQPYVLSRHWPLGRIWTDDDEFNAGQHELYTLISGLLRRCRKKVYLGYNQLSEQGIEQRGVLLMTIHQMLRRIQREEATDDSAE